MWEYLIVDAKRDALGDYSDRWISIDVSEKDLNEYGEDGWELVAIVYGKLYFKRER